MSLTVPRPTWMSSPEHDWPEDFSHENGQYHGFCLQCQATYIGRKGRVLCKPCALKNKAEWDSLSQEEKDKRAAEIKEALIRMNGGAP